MPKDYSVFQIPFFNKNEESYVVNTVSSSDFDIYKELNAIAEEIEKCRLRNS